jgi:hypothetical protein
VADAVASGALKASSLATRFTAAEAELDQLTAQVCGSGGMIRNYNGTQQRKNSPSHEIFFDERHIKQYRPINELLI